MHMIASNLLMSRLHKSKMYNHKSKMKQARSRLALFLRKYTNEEVSRTMATSSPIRARCNDTVWVYEIVLLGIMKNYMIAS